MVWGYLACRFKKQPLWLLAGFLIIAIPLSRIYLGAHFPTDLLGGYAIGALVLFLFLLLGSALEIVRFTRKGIFYQLGVSVGLPVLLILVIPSGNDGLLTAPWCLNGGGHRRCPGTPLGAFCSDGPWWQQVIRYFVGIVILFGVWLGLRFAFDQLEPVDCTGLSGMPWSGCGAAWGRPGCLCI